MLLVTRPQAVAAGSLLIGFVLLCAKLVVGVLTGSLGVISEAAHSGFDLAASGFALFAVRTAAKPADREHPYGHGRAENLAAFGEGLVLLLTALWIAYEALRRLLGEPARVDPASYALGLMVASMVVEAGRAAVLRSVGRSSGRFSRAARKRSAAGVGSRLGRTMPLSRRAIASRLSMRRWRRQTESWIPDSSSASRQASTCW